MQIECVVHLLESQALSESGVGQTESVQCLLKDGGSDRRAGPLALPSTSALWALCPGRPDSAE